MDRIEITPEQKDAILALEESHFCDLKSKQILPSKLTESVSAFANASGGEIYLGIDEFLMHGKNPGDGMGSQTLKR